MIGSRILSSLSVVADKQLLLHPGSPSRAIFPWVILETHQCVFLCLWQPFCWCRYEDLHVSPFVPTQRTESSSGGCHQSHLSPPCPVLPSSPIWKVHSTGDQWTHCLLALHCCFQALSSDTGSVQAVRRHHLFWAYLMACLQHQCLRYTCTVCAGGIRIEPLVVK